MSAEFFFISLLLTIVPGTGVVYTLSCAMSQGLRGAFWGAVAGAVGVIPHLLAAGLGLSALLMTYPMLYDSLRIIGGCYLIWLAVQAWRQRHQMLETSRVPLTGRRIVVQGALINLLNPKLTLFFVSFLPQFVSASAPNPALTIALLGSVLIAQTFVVFLVYGAIAAWAGNALRLSPRLMAGFQISIAGIFTMMGLRVLAGR